MRADGRSCFGHGGRCLPPPSGFPLPWWDSAAQGPLRKWPAAESERSAARRRSAAKTDRSRAAAQPLAVEVGRHFPRATRSSRSSWWDKRWWGQTKTTISTVVLVGRVLPLCADTTCIHRTLVLVMCQVESSL